MLNKKEREEVCECVASWEFIVGGSSSEANAYALCAEKLKHLFGITDEDLVFNRAWKIGEIIYDQSEETIDKLYNAIEDDYEGLLNSMDVRDYEQNIKDFIAKY